MLPLYLEFTESEGGCLEYVPVVCSLGYDLWDGINVVVLLYPPAIDQCDTGHRRLG